MAENLGKRNLCFLLRKILLITMICHSMWCIVNYDESHNFKNLIGVLYGRVLIENFMLIF